MGSLHVGSAAVALPDLISSQQGAALILDSHINQPGRVRPVLQADTHAPVPADPAARDQTVTGRFHGNRAVIDRTLRNQRIDHQNFDPTHGSFQGW